MICICAVSYKTGFSFDKFTKLIIIIIIFLFCVLKGYDFQNSFKIITEKLWDFLAYERMLDALAIELIAL